MHLIMQEKTNLHEDLKKVDTRASPLIWCVTLLIAMYLLLLLHFLPMHTRPFCIHKEVYNEAIKRGLYKVCIGMYLR